MLLRGMREYAEIRELIGCFQLFINHITVERCEKKV